MTLSSLLENLALRCLGVSKVHHLIHELVDDDEVVADGLLLELLEVLDEHLHDAVQEQDDLRRVRVALREREHWAARAGRSAGRAQARRRTHGRGSSAGCACS